jgi:hypothetical protein
MRSQQPAAARRWLLLTIVTALAALGVWAGGHCAEPHDAPGPVSARSATGAHDADETPATRQLPGVDDDHCQVTAAHAVAAAPNTVAAITEVRAYGRITPPSPPRPAQPVPPGITLSALGVSRT